MKLGNGLWEQTVFNSRLQPLLIGLGTIAPPLDGPQKLDRFRIDYAYDGPNNNGNVIDQAISIPPYNSSSQKYQLKLTQHYSYDGLNRLKTATESSTTETSNNAPSWQETVNYDQYGNRSIDAALTTSDLVRDNPQVSTSTNRITPRLNEQYHYDAAGNLDRDKADVPFSYDANNHVVAFNGGAAIGTTGTNYYFDGLGQRVKKADYYSSTVFVYDALGNLVAEYATDGQTGAGTSYITTDTLGTPRVMTDAGGGVRARHDYLPFGEEIGGAQVSLKGGRNASQMYVSDGVRQKFTGQERDNESGLDYFLARDYQSGHGRFTSVDPLMTSAKAGNPQTWNRYTYAWNNPLRLNDPLGMDPQEGDSNDPFQTQEQKKKKQEQQLPPPTTKVDLTDLSLPPSFATPQSAAPPPSQIPDEFDSGLPPVFPAGPPVPARLIEITGARNDVNVPGAVKADLQYQVVDQYNKPFLPPGFPPGQYEAFEEIEVLPGRIPSDAPDPITGTDLVSAQGTVEDHITLERGDLLILPDNTNIPSRQTIYIIDHNTKTRYDVRLNGVTITRSGIYVRDATNGPNGPVSGPRPRF